MDAKFIHGTPWMVDYTPSTDVSGGDVVEVGDLPLVAHRDIDADIDEKGALAAGGGVYEMTAGEAIAAGKQVYWNATTERVYDADKTGSGTSGEPVFGYVEPDSSATAAGDTIRVMHMPIKNPG